MRPSLSLKTLLRAPFKTLMTFLLIGAASFALFYRVADYSVTQREMSRVTNYYRGVAALDTGVPNTALLLASHLPNTSKYSYYKEEQKPPAPLTAEQIKEISSLSGVSSTDTRYMTAGVINELKRVVRYSSYAVNYNYTDRFVLEGTIADLTQGDYGGAITNQITLTDYIQLAGEMPLEQEGNLIINTFASEGSDNVLTRGSMSVFYVIYNNPFGQSFADSLKVGDRCLILGRWSSEYFDDLSVFVGDQDTLDYCDSFYLLNDKPENYLDTEEFSKVREIIDITNRDFNTFDIVYTSDMLSIPRFNERKMVIQEGRALTDADTSACVINLSLMEFNGLKIGDKISVDLCDKLFYQRDGLGATAVIHERYGAIVDTVELEIVGAYIDTDAQHERNASVWWSYTPNTIFVPLSFLPVDPPSDYGIRPGEFSLVIDDALKMKSFINEAEPHVKDMGIKLRFSDSGWLKVEDSIGSSQRMSFMTTALYVAATAMALILAGYLYIGRSKRTYAIMRALGSPKNKANKALLLPLSLLSAFAILLGSIFGMVYASKNISTVLGSLSAAANQQYIPDSSLPVFTLIACLVCEIIFLLLIFMLFIKKLANTPTLALLQQNTIGKKVRKANKEAINEKPIESIAPIFDFTSSFSISSDMAKPGGYGGIKHVTRYIILHMRRSSWKTLLVIMLTVLLTGAMGFLAVTRLSYQNLFDKTEVIGSLNNYSSSAVMEASKSDLIEDFYYSGGWPVIINDVAGDSGYLLAFTNDIDRYVQGKSIEEYAIEYAEGFDASFFSYNEPQCLIGSFLAEQYSVKPGDNIRMLSWDRQYILSSIYKDNEEFLSRIEEISVEFKVAGVIKSEDFHIGMGLFAPLSQAAEEISDYGQYPFPVELGEYKLVDKEDPYRLREYLDSLKRDDKKYTELVSYNMDTTEVDNVKRVRDMLIMLFPIAVAVAILIGVIASALIVMQSAKEVAILRILGTSKSRARCMVIFEQLGLSIVGLILVVLGLIVYNAELFVQSSASLILCGGLYLLTCTMAVVLMSIEISRRKILELLQVKE